MKDPKSISKVSLYFVISLSFRNVMNDVDYLENQIMETMNASVDYDDQDREHQGSVGHVKKITHLSILTWS